MFPEVVCPVHRSAMTTATNAIVCPHDHGYTIREGIPRLVASADNYAEAFGLQWRTYRQTQLDSYTGTAISRQRLQRCIGDADWARLESGGRTEVLEVGCGAGRFTELLVKTRGAAVTSIDYSSAVEANVENCPQNDRHRVLQADALLLPFEPEQFDLVLCLGVIQHTPRPEETIQKLYEQVKPGGMLVIDHYTYDLSRLTKIGYAIRPILKRLPPDDGLRWTERIVRALFPLHRAVRRHRLLQMLLSRVSPVHTYFSAYPELSDRLQFEWALLDTHDALTDWFKHLRTTRQIRETLTGLGAEHAECWRGGNGVEARARRPA